MYLSHSTFAEYWWGYPPSIHKFIAFCYLYDKERELRAFRRLFRAPVSELKRLTGVYVARIQVRPLLVTGALSFARSTNPKDLFKFCHIYIKCDISKYEELKTFVHELIHIYLCEQGIIVANEDWIETASERIMQKHRIGVEKLFNDQEVEYVQPKT